MCVVTVSPDARRVPWLAATPALRRSSKWTPRIHRAHGFVTSS
jgi:hypothetical protein